MFIQFHNLYFYVQRILLTNKNIRGKFEEDSSRVEGNPSSLVSGLMLYGNTVHQALFISSSKVLLIKKGGLRPCMDVIKVLYSIEHRIVGRTVKNVVLNIDIHNRYMLWLHITNDIVNRSRLSVWKRK